MAHRTIVVSDIHLGAIPPANEAAFLRFLERVPDLGHDLLINGDLFDFWYEYGEVVPRGHFRILSALHQLVRRGIPIRYLGGNHDAWGGSFLEDEVGVEIVDGPARLEVGGRRAYVAHGDGLGGGDWGYRLLKWSSRSRPGRFAFRLLHPGVGIPLARLASSTEGKGERGDDYVSPRAPRLAALAHDLLRAQDDLDLVIFGHTHHPVLEEVAPGRFYLNAGDWIDSCTYAVVSPDEIALHHFDGH